LQDGVGSAIRFALIRVTGLAHLHAALQPPRTQEPVLAEIRGTLVGSSAPPTDARDRGP
jgi:hypothetical protein